MGEAGLVEQSSAKAKSLKLRAKGLSSCHPNGQQPRQPDKGQIKGLLSRHGTKRKQRQSSSKSKHCKGQKAACKRKAARLKKGKTLTLGSKLAVAEGGGVCGDEVIDE